MSRHQIEKVPAYAVIAERLRLSISAGRLPLGAVLLEGHLARIFGSSRAPVRQALEMLETEGIVRHYDGRGLLVGDATEPRRIELTRDLLQAHPQEGGAKLFAWQAFYYEFERDLTLQSMFGRFTVNELALSRYFRIGRTVARDLLLQAQLLGLVEKGENSRWTIIPLDEVRLENLYQLRMLLEPPVLRDAARKVPPDVLADVRARLIHASQSFPSVNQEEFDRIEIDLHVNLLSYARNFEAFEALRRCRPTVIVGKHMDNAMTNNTIVDPYVDEHMVDHQ